MSNLYLRKLRTLPEPQNLSYSRNAVSLFSGGGGLDVGLALSGFETVFATDIESAHCETIAHNFPCCKTLAIDARQLTGQQIRKLTHITSFDLLAGGPPCQAFSILGQRNSFQDPRGQLVYEYVRLVTELNPQAFLFENVPGLLTLNGGRDWNELLQYFHDATAYKIYYRVLNSADYGIPQIRKRVFIVGFRLPEVKFEFPNSSHRSDNGAADLFNGHLSKWLPASLALEEVNSLPNHRIRPHGERVRNRYSAILPGTRDSVDHTDRIDPKRPSGTVLVGSRAGGGRPFIHPYEPRHITVREAARLQSFPDWYVFQSTDTWQYRAVGNAVPPLLAKLIGDQIRIALESVS